MNKDTVAPGGPWDLFKEWFAAAQQNESSYPNAMMLATVGQDGMPTARAVLLKGYDTSGFVFFTNRESRKGHHLGEHAKASLCFYWKSLQRQIRIEGMVTCVSDQESDDYFYSRPRESQLGAWASHQSRKLTDRAELERAIAEAEKHYQGRDVPRPPYWGGYRLVPTYFEFWQERDFRLHDRLIYTRSQNDMWVKERLYP